MTLRWKEQSQEKFRVKEFCIWMHILFEWEVWYKDILQIWFEKLGTCWFLLLIKEGRKSIDFSCGGQTSGFNFGSVKVKTSLSYPN